MTEVGSTDLSRLLQSKRNELGAIVTARKRKLRELFAVATHVDTLPNDAFTNADATTSTSTEWKFLQANDILQGRKLNDLTIPHRPTLNLVVLQQSLATTLFSNQDGALPIPTTDSNDEPDLDHDVQRPASESKVTVTKIPRQPSSPPLPNVPVTTDPTSLQADSPSQPSALKDVENGEGHQQSPKSIGQEDVPNPRDGSGTVSSGRNEEAKRQQVTFPPGTKGSSSPENGQIAELASSATSQTRKIDKVPKRPTQDGDGSKDESLAIQLPADSSRAPYVPSSPGSTAPSATTTPAVHDVSTDTSPDHDALQYVEGYEPKGEERNDGADNQHQPPNDQSTSAPTKKDPTAPVIDTAEAQLLQESLTSSARLSEQSPLATAQADANVDEDVDVKAMGVVASPDGSSQQLPTIQPDVNENSKAEAEQQPARDETARPVEIPDSEEERSSQTEANVKSMAKQAVAEDKILTPREPNLPTQHESRQHFKEDTTEKVDAVVSERAITRVSSGAMRRKSVNEIVGVTPRNSGTLERKDSHTQLTPATSNPQTPIPRTRAIISHQRERSRSQASTVLFGKQPHKQDEQAIVAGAANQFRPSEDYFTPLFIQGFAGGSNWMQSLEKLLYSANKIVATPDINLAIQDAQACKILRRVYTLQQQDKWSLRQPKRSCEPSRPVSQWDVMLKEMKWMRTDFREERKWKMAVAKNLAYSCAQWHEASLEERKAMQVAVLASSTSTDRREVVEQEMLEVANDAQTIPDLVPSGDGESPRHIDELVDDPTETLPPSVLFSLNDDDVVFGLRRTPASDQLLDELPLYGAPLQQPKSGTVIPDFDPDAHWRRRALPLSKYVEAPMTLSDEGPPRKRGRFSYRGEESEDEVDSGFIAEQQLQTDILPSMTSEVALFSPEQKHIRDRLHAGHQFRPPSEHPMPTQGFYECRNPSQWTVNEDDELRSLVREHSYNWSLISSTLAMRSGFTSGAERRTPWECFERWTNLEGLPGDMQRTQYFKAYNSRIDAAQRTIAMQNQMAAQQATASGNTTTPVRRRPSVPVRVERRRNQKHLTMIDAMRKLAKKRETILQKQQHNASQNAASKKPTDSTMTRGAPKTPREYSLIRWERDQALAEKMAQYAQRQDAQRRVAAQARAQSQVQATVNHGNGPAAGAPNGHHPSHPNGMGGANRGSNAVNQMAAVAAVAAAPGSVPGAAGPLANGQVRGRVPMQASPMNIGQNGVSMVNNGPAPTAQMNGTQQAQIQAMQVQGQQQRMQIAGQQQQQQQPDPHLLMQARRLQEQQRATALQQIQQQQHAVHGIPGQQGGQLQQGSPPMRGNLNGNVPLNYMNTAQAMMASFNMSNGNHANPSTNGLSMPNGMNGPPGARAPPQIPTIIMTQIHQLEAQFRAKNPALTPEQARQLAAEHISRTVLARQSAMNAAAGGTGQPGLSAAVAATTSPHQYAAMLRQQQQQQAQAQAQALAQGQTPQQQQQQQQLAQQQQQQQQQQLQQQQHLQMQQRAQEQRARSQMSTSPVPIPMPPQAHQRQASGSATPSAPS